MFGLIVYIGLLALIPSAYFLGVLLGIDYERRRYRAYVQKKKAKAKQCKLSV